MSNDPFNPFDDDALDEIRKRLKEIAEARKLCAKCQRAGIDVSEHMSTLDEVEKRLRGIKREFFPNSR